MTDPITPAPSLLPGGNQSLNPSASDIPAPLTPRVQQQQQQTQDAPWDTFEKAIFGEQNGSLLGGVPGIGQLGRALVDVPRGIVNVGGVGVSDALGAIGTGLSKIPSPDTWFAGDAGTGYGLGNDLTSSVNWKDTTRYAPTPTGAVNLIEDLNKENGGLNLARQFFVLGQWQKANDPTAFADWEKTLKDAQSGDMNLAAEKISRYISDAATSYYDQTPNGYQGFFDTHPELAFGGEGTFGKALSDTLQRVFVFQSFAERGAAQMSGSQAGLKLPWDMAHYYYGSEDAGSRLNELMYLADNNPGKLTPVEAAAVKGVRDMGWTTRHAYDFLIDHGQGFSSSGVSQLLTGVALDPIGVATLGASAAASVGTKIAEAGGVAGRYSALASTTRIGQLSDELVKAIGTSVDAVRSNPVLGPIAKVARTVIDPISGLPGAHGAAMKNVWSAVGADGWARGFGHGAVSSVQRIADNLGIRAAVDSAAGESAMNWSRKFVAASHISSLLREGKASSRMVIPEETLQAVGESMPRDAATRLADYVYTKRKFYLSAADKSQLGERISKAFDVPIEQARGIVDAAPADQQALWHDLTYRAADAEYAKALAEVSPDVFSKISPAGNEMVLLNPNEIDNLTAQNLVKTIAEAKNHTEGIAAWNAAADRFEAIARIGRVTTGGASQLAKRVEALQRDIENGMFHTALDEAQTGALPQSFKDSFLNRWIGSDGKPIWRLGFAPKAEQATGLVSDTNGELVARYDPNIPNLHEGIVPPTRNQPLTDALGRAIQSTPLYGPLRSAKDAVEVAANTAMDQVSSERLMASMEQEFRRGAQQLGLSDQVARNTFRAVRKSATQQGFTLAGLSPDQFWRASEPYLKDVMDVTVAKRDLFDVLLKSAGGDMRLIGLTSGLTQRLRSALVARGLDPNNWLGRATVQGYNIMRYALNPMFFLQAVTDAPWFNMYRGVMFDMLGKVPAPGSKIAEMQRVMSAIGHTGMYRDVSMDFTERVATSFFGKDLVDNLDRLPGVNAGLRSRLANWAGQMVLNNELGYIHSQVGEAVYRSVERVQQVIDEKIATAASDAERAVWEGQRNDPKLMMQWFEEEVQHRLGYMPDRNTIGLHYLTDLIDDSRLEQRTPEGLLDYHNAQLKASHFIPSNAGEIKPVNLDYGAVRLGLPNIRNAIDLRDAIGRGTYTIGDVKDILTQIGDHPDAIKRFTTRLMFNWNDYMGALRKELGMSHYEMQGIEDIIRRQAHSMGMDAADYLTQVMPFTVKDAARAAREVPEDVKWTPRATPLEPGADMFDHTIANGGGTFDGATGKEMGLTRGYGVANGNFGKIVPADKGAVEAAYREVSRTGAPHIGTWKNPETGMIHVDPTQVVMNKKEAIRLAEARGEEAIFNFKDYSDIPISHPLKGVNAELKFILHTMRLVSKGEAGVEEMTRLVASHLQPSMKQALLDHFMSDLTGPDGLIQKAYDAAGAAKDPAEKANYTALGQNLQRSLEQLKGGWGDAADAKFRDLVVRRAGGEVTATGSTLPQPWKDTAYARTTELVPIDQIAPFREIDREVTPKWSGHMATAPSPSSVSASTLPPDAMDAWESIGVGTGLEKWTGTQVPRVGSPNTVERVDSIRNGHNIVSYIQRDEAGRIAGYASFGVEGTRADEVLNVGVREDVRRQGIATRLYDTAQSDGLDVRRVSGAHGVTDDGKAFSEAYRARAQTNVHLDELTEDIRVNGFREPAILEYDPVNGLALLGEGNRRLAVAKRLGLDSVPVRVVRTDLSSAYDQARAIKIADQGMTPKVHPDGTGYFPGELPPSKIGFNTSREIADTEVERAARYFSSWLQNTNPAVQAGDVMKNIVANIPVEGASPYHFTQSVLINTVLGQMSLAERDAIRLAQISMDRSVLERSLNHPFFALYPTSYMWGKVLPETVRFLAYKPFGIQTAAGLQTYYKAKSSIAAQSQYDDSLKDLWDKVGKSQIMGAISYMTPSMPWEDMKGNLPLWVRDLAKGKSFSATLDDEFNTFSPDRWIKHFTQATDEAGQIVSTLTSDQQQGLRTISMQNPGTVSAPGGAPSINGPIQGTGLAPVLSNDFQELQRALAGG